MDGLDAAGINRLVVDLSKAASSIGPKAAVAVHKTASDIESTGKALCPVDTGATRNSIGVDYSNSLSYVEANIGPTTDYAAFVEFGTSTHGPQAFMGPALDRHGYELDRALGTLAGGIL